MSYEFTKLSDVPIVDSFPVGANTIIETNGEIRRCTSAGYRSNNRFELQRQSKAPDRR